MFTIKYEDVRNNKGMKRDDLFPGLFQPKPEGAIRLYPAEFMLPENADKPKESWLDIWNFGKMTQEVRGRRDSNGQRPVKEVLIPCGYGQAHGIWKYRYADRMDKTFFWWIEYRKRAVRLVFEDQYMWFSLGTSKWSGWTNRLRSLWYEAVKNYVVPENEKIEDIMRQMGY